MKKFTQAVWDLLIEWGEYRYQQYKRQCYQYH
jgi:hypothetical protein